MHFGEIMIFIYLWLVSKTPKKKKKSSIRDFALKLLGTFPHTLEDTALFVRSDYRPQGIWPGKV